MIYAILPILIFSMSLFSSEIINTEKTGRYLIETIKIGDHTYIHIRNDWNIKDNHMWHDPECAYCKQKINEALAKGKK